MRLLRDELAVGALVDGVPECHVRARAFRRLAVPADLVVAREIPREDAGAEDEQHREGDHHVDPPLFGLRQAAATARRRSRSGRRNWPVYDSGTRATSSGGPAATPPPPPSPPSAPRSTSQSACLITSRLCSITRTVLPESTSRCST